MEHLWLLFDPNRLRCGACWLHSLASRMEFVTCLCVFGSKWRHSGTPWSSPWWSRRPTKSAPSWGKTRASAGSVERTHTHKRLLLTTLLVVVILPFFFLFRSLHCIQIHLSMEWRLRGFGFSSRIFGHLADASIQSLQPFIHTFTRWRRSQPCKATARLVGSS